MFFETGSSPKGVICMIETRQLGQTGLKVSLICLGTMTWGEQNTEEEAHLQMDYALERGVNFWDTAEMYPVPPRAPTQGLTESYIGSWFKSRKGRERVILATKVVGPMGFPWIREGKCRLNRPHIRAAIEGSLRRLETDYIDLYQLHWPDRNANFFGKLGYQHDPQEVATPIVETLEALAELISEGKIRAIGLSNETAWGAMQFLALAKQYNLPRVAAIQNPYNLLNRTYEVGLAEVSCREACGLLAYSPLAMGVLSGKYEGGRSFPAKARLTLFERFQRYQSARGWAASEAYVKIARDHGLSPTKMALAFVNQQAFVTSNIIGATSLEQLKENIDSADLVLSPEIIAAIEAIHADNPSPCP
jgi:aryl-alcohol dehydrogenase-like predicted oxidoreductase